jgi:hypothetical protein
LRARFNVGRIFVVADRGMISAQSIAALEERKLEYRTEDARAALQQRRPRTLMAVPGRERAAAETVVSLWGD